MSICLRRRKFIGALGGKLPPVSVLSRREFGQRALRR
jgi:hypothetical protein